MEEATPRPPLTHCLDCTRPVSGKYCANCGQRIGPVQRPFWSMLAEFIGESFALDGRLFRSLFPLLFKPGTLTREYNAGRRTRFVSPFKLYLMSAFVLFFSFTVESWIAALTVVESTPPAATAPSTVGDTNSLPTDPAAVPAPPPDERRGPRFATAGLDRVDVANSPPFVKRMIERLENLDHDDTTAAAVESAWISALPMTLFLLLPLLALLTLGVLAGHRRYYAEAMVFSLHASSFTYLLVLAMRYATSLPGRYHLLWVIPCYFVVAFARAFDLRWYSALLRSIVLGAIFIPVLGVMLTAALLYAAGM